MLGEIDKNYYCTTHESPELMCPGFKECSCGEEECIYKHNKYPSDEHYLKEYNRVYPDENAVYVCFESENKLNVCVMEYGEAKKLKEMRNINKGTISPIIYRICACTPWGRPPDGWKGERNGGDDK